MLTVMSVERNKQFGHVTWYAADVESGQIRFQRRTKFLPFVFMTQQFL